mmetsp:Transcript_41859/g.95893  ORF Transcript_41859/g.95893 Transcript_41859/m.95893 type:complete len:267 (-) Transcript_41859:2726-3526(-)
MQPWPGRECRHSDYLTLGVHVYKEPNEAAEGARIRKVRVRFGADSGQRIAEREVCRSFGDLGCNLVGGRECHRETGRQHADANVDTVHLYSINRKQDVGEGARIDVNDIPTAAARMLESYSKPNVVDIADGDGENTEWAHPHWGLLRHRVDRAALLLHIGVGVLQRKLLKVLRPQVTWAAPLGAADEAVRQQYALRVITPEDLWLRLQREMRDQVKELGGKLARPVRQHLRDHLRGPWQWKEALCRQRVEQQGRAADLERGVENCA